MADHETAPDICPICMTHPLRQIAPQLWDCTSRRCNSQFYVDGERLLMVRDRVPRETLFGRKPYRCSQAQLANRRAAIGFAILAAASFAGSMWLDQPVLALAAFLFLATAAIIAKDA